MVLVTRLKTLFPTLFYFTPCVWVRWSARWLNRDRKHNLPWEYVITFARALRGSFFEKRRVLKWLCSTSSYRNRTRVCYEAVPNFILRQRLWNSLRFTQTDRGSTSRPPLSPAFLRTLKTSFEWHKNQTIPAHVAKLCLAFVFAVGNKNVLNITRAATWWDIQFNVAV